MGQAETRTGGFDLLRLALATCVILAHSPEMIDGNRSRELLGRWVHGSTSLGDLAVDGFFLLSGFLITQSWVKRPVLRAFVEKRLRRIVPGFLVAYVGSVVAVGVLAPGTPHFFVKLLRYPAAYLQLLFLGSPEAPPVLPGMPYPFVNGAMWTIQYELRCYLLVAVLGMAGVFRRHGLLLVLTGAALCATVVGALQERLAWNHLHAITGSPHPLFRLGSTFLVGCCFYVFRERIPYRAVFSWLMGAVMAGALVLRPDHFEPVFAVGAGYLMFFAARCGWFRDFRSPLPDISYGVYLYAWPIGSVWIYRMHGSPWVAFGVTALIAFGLGWLSWTFVESPWLTRKQRMLHGSRETVAA